MSALRRKGLVVILDGVGDRPQEALDGHTPLEAAHTPNLDRLVAEGLCGLVDPLLPGVPVDTHVGCGVLLLVMTGGMWMYLEGTDSSSKR